jgi:hypothetical protein
MGKRELKDVHILYIVLTQTIDLRWLCVVKLSRVIICEYDRLMRDEPKQYLYCTNEREGTATGRVGGSTTHACNTISLTISSSHRSTSSVYNDDSHDKLFACMPSKSGIEQTL